MGGLSTSEYYALYEALQRWRNQIDPDAEERPHPSFPGLMRVGAYGEMVTRHLAVCDGKGSGT